MAKRNYKMKQGSARRAAKSWSKGGAYRDVDDEFVPTRAVPIKPRSKDLRQPDRDDALDAPEGRVVDSSGRAWIVELAADDGTTTHYECTPSRTIVTAEEGATLVAVGDKVSIRPDDDQVDADRLPTAIIVKVHPRISRLSRKTAGRYDEEHVIASNVDQLVVLASVGSPWYNKRLIDRYLVAAHRGELDPILVVNKVDLVAEEDLEVIVEDLIGYEDSLGLPLLFVSQLEGIGLEELREALAGHTSVFSGPSGVGKSSLINKLLGRDIQETRFINQRTNKGMHTTTFSRMFRLPDGGFVVDTPGIREFGVWDVTRAELPLCFPDLSEVAADCRFNSCSHTHEPDCAVKAAVEAEELDPERYVSYLQIFESLPE